jgi:tRNA pseudouridine38-40 synthase
MPRYFIEVAYKGTAYSGFQVQQNANTIQAEVERAIKILLPPSTIIFNNEANTFLTGSSRTDAGVHALQNFFHLDTTTSVQFWPGIEGNINKFTYKLNAILPADIAIKKIIPVSPESHSRFDAVYREYKYYICQYKNPFLQDRSYHFPFKLNVNLLQEAATILKEYTDFTSFSKRNTQVKTFQCQIANSQWLRQDGCLVYNVTANRFLRGMVRALTATMLKVGREKISISNFRQVIEAKDCTQASFAVPAHGLFLVSVIYPFEFQ